MGKRVYGILTVLALALLIIVPVVNAADLRTVKVYVHLKENCHGVNEPAVGVQVTLYAPDAGGIPIAWGTTNGSGSVYLSGGIYSDEDLGIYYRRTTAGGECSQSIPLRYAGTRPVIQTNRWELWSTYYHTGGGTVNSWVPLKPDR